MKTNDLKKGDKVNLRNGFTAIIEDSKKGNIRMAKVFGNYTEIGSIYAWDIMSVVKENKVIAIELTATQLKSKNLTFSLGF
jgi:hypothetical protein